MWGSRLFGADLGDVPYIRKGGAEKLLFVELREYVPSLLIVRRSLSNNTRGSQTLGGTRVSFIQTTIYGHLTYLAVDVFFFFNVHAMRNEPTIVLYHATAWATSRPSVWC